MPNNLRLEALIVNNADLLIETRVPECLLTLCAHVAAYKAVLKQWEEDNFTAHTSPIIFPRSALREYVGPAYRRLKEEQAELLGKLQHQVERNSVEGMAARIHRTSATTASAKKGDLEH